MEIFWKTIAYYNSSTWLPQIFIVITGLVLTVLLVRKPRRWIKEAMKIYLTALYLWIAVVYYFICCDERDYNDVMAMFWVLIVAWILLAMPFVYPAISLARGLTFPTITSPVMPCSVVVFTIGLLLLFTRKINIFLVLLLCHWSLLGLSKIYQYQIPEDFMLVGITIPGLYLFFREYFLTGLSADTKPKAKYINALLIIVCLGLAALLTATMLSAFIRQN